MRADGKRIVHGFNKSDPVRYLFEFIKAEVPEAESKTFEVFSAIRYSCMSVLIQMYFQLISVRDPLLPRINDTIQEAGLTGASISVAFE